MAKNHYIKIPIEIAYNKDLSSNSKMLYGTIALLCHKNGYCYASNEFLSEKINVTERTIRRLLNELSNENYISIEYFKNNIRHIRIAENNVLGDGNKCSLGTDDRVHII